MQGMFGPGAFDEAHKKIDNVLTKATARGHPHAPVWDGCLHERADTVLGQPDDLPWRRAFSGQHRAFAGTL